MDTEDKAKSESARKQRRAKPNAMKITDFCKRNSLGRSTFYSLVAQGLGPKIMKIGKSVRISRRAERSWIRRMEKGRASKFNSKANSG